MKMPSDETNWNYVRDYQNIDLEGPDNILQGQQVTHAFNFPFRFVMRELIAHVVVFTEDLLLNFTFNELLEPPILTSMKYHQTLLDDQPIPLRSAWGTARRPAVLPIPIPVEQGTNISVDSQFVIPFGGPFVPASAGYRLLYTVRGYQPSDREFDRIRKNNDKICVRPYQTFTLQQKNGASFVDAKKGAQNWDENPSVPFSIDFPMDFFGVKAVAEAFDVDNLDALSAPVNLPDPEITLRYVTKSAQLNTSRELFRTIFGTAEFPTMLMPNQQYKQGDLARIDLVNNIRARVSPFMSFVGFAPTPAFIRRGDIQRGRTKPEAYDPQSIIGGKAKK